MGRYVSSFRNTPLLDRFIRDLELTSGRISRSLRITLASIIVLILMLALRMPFMAYGLYVVFLVSGESPSASLRTGLAATITATIAVGLELGIVVLTDNNPIARLLSVAIVTFFAGLLVAGSTQPSLGSSFGLLYCVMISFWERHDPASVSVNSSLRFLAAFALAVGSTVGVEYLFGAKSPSASLSVQMCERYQALGSLFQLCADNAEIVERRDAASRVSSLAAAGQSGMLELYNQVVDRDLDAGELPAGTRLHIAMLAGLMESSAAFGLGDEAMTDKNARERCQRIAYFCGLMATATAIPDPTYTDVAVLNRKGSSLLDQVESALQAILRMPRKMTARKTKQLALVPSKRVPFLKEGSLSDRSNVAFGLKISLCATLCYVLYHAIDWPGVSTSVVTVMVTGLSTTAAMKQRIIFRVAGALFGGMILGIGSTVFLFPYMDSITSLVVLVSVVAFSASWVTSGARFSYVGLQTAFSFYLVSFAGFGPPTALAPARDRLIGILLALVVMWVVFDQLWPVRTVTAMRRTLAQVLKNASEVFRLDYTPILGVRNVQREDLLRDHLGSQISSLRAQDEIVEYELGADQHLQAHASDLILQSALSVAALVWNQVAHLHDRDHESPVFDLALVELRATLTTDLAVLAQAIDGKQAIPAPARPISVPGDLLADDFYGEYARNILARHGDLRLAILRLSREGYAAG